MALRLRYGQRIANPDDVLPDEQLGPLRVAFRDDRNAQEGRRSRREHQQTDRMQGDGVRDRFDAATLCEPRTLADPELLAGPLEVNREGRLASLS